MKKVIKYIILGMMVGFVMMTLSLLVLLLVLPEPEVILTKTYMLRNIWCSALVGIAFYVPSMVYENDRLPKVLQVTIHMGIGYLVFFPLSIYAKWIPITGGVGAIIGFISFVLVVSFSIWFGFYLHAKNEAKMINQKLKKKLDY